MPPLLEEPVSADTLETADADRHTDITVEHSQDKAEIGTRLEVAQQLDAAGMNVTAIRADGSKAPVGSWKELQTNRTGLARFPTMFAPTSAFGIGIVTGVISGDVEMIEIEGRAMDRLPILREAIERSGLTNVWLRLWNGLRETSPSGGVHLFARVIGGQVRGNTTLAYEPDPEGRPGKHGDKLAETRGEGGIAVMAPSGGAVHPTGRSWVRETGSPRTIPEIAAEDRDALYEVIRVTLDESGTVNALTRVTSGGVEVLGRLSRADVLTLIPGGPIDPAYGPVLAPVTPTGMSHDDLLDVTSALAKVAVLGRKPGGREAVELARAAYIGSPDVSWGTKTAAEYGRAFDDAVVGSAALWAVQRAEQDEFGGRLFGSAPASPPEPIAAVSAADSEPVDDPFAGLSPGAREHLQRRLDKEEGDAAYRRMQGPLESLGDRIVFGADVLKIPSLDPLVEGWLPLGVQALVVGQTGLGKSTWLDTLALAVWNGRPFYGHATTRRNVLIVSTEGAGGLAAKLRAISAEFSLPLPMSGRESGFGVLGAVDMSDPTEAAALAAECHRMDAGLVILDTVNTTKGSLDENAASDMGTYLTRARALVAHTGGTVIVVHHPPRDELDRERGSGALRDNSDVMFVLKGKPTDWTLTRKKNKYGIQGDSLGRFTTGEVVRRQEAASEFSHPIADAVRAFLATHDGAKKGEIVAALMTQGNPKSPTENVLKQMENRGEMTVEHVGVERRCHLAVAVG